VKKAFNCFIAGLGRSGKDIHLKLINQMSNFSLVGVFDVDKKISRKIAKKYDCKFYDSYQNGLEDNAVDIVVIATPSALHYEMSLKAIKANKHVILEKPLTSTLKEFKDLTNYAKRKNVSVFPFFNFRFSPEFLKIQEILEKNLIGDVFLIKRNVGYFNRRSDWQSENSKFGGILNAAAIHHIDQILQLDKSGISRYFCDSKSLVSKGGADDHIKILIKFKSSIIADIEVSWVESVKTYPWVIYGTKGSILQKDNKIIVKFFKEEEVEIKKRNRYSYLSHEKINWHEERFVFDKKFALGINVDFYISISRYLQKLTKQNPIPTSSVIKLLNFLEEIKD